MTALLFPYAWEQKEFFAFVAGTFLGLILGMLYERLRSDDE